MVGFKAPNECSDCVQTDTAQRKSSFMIMQSRVKREKVNKSVILEVGSVPD